MNNVNVTLANGQKISVPVKKYLQNVYRGYAGASKAINELGNSDESELMRIYKDKQLDVNGVTYKAQAFDVDYKGRGRPAKSTDTENRQPEPISEKKLAAAPTGMPSIGLKYEYTKTGRAWIVDSYSDSKVVMRNADNGKTWPMTVEYLAQHFSRLTPAPAPNWHGEGRRILNRYSHT